MTVDRNAIIGRIEIIDRNLTFLDEAAPEFDPDTASFTKKQAIKYTLLEVVEACLDIASHIVSAEGYGRPEEYAALFRALAQHDVVPTELSRNLEDMARFRNLLVHRYAEIDDERLKEILVKDLDDVRSFVKHVYSYMDDLPRPESGDTDWDEE